MVGLRPVHLPLYWSVGCLLCLFGPSSSSSPAVQGSQLLVCNPSDRDALLGFSASLDSGVPGWPRNGTSSNCCHWPGVRCGVFSTSRNSSGVLDSRVVGLQLGNKSLQGTVDWKPLPCLAELRYLKVLNLSQNSLSGVISAKLFRLRELEVLDLSTNVFSGELSDGIRNLSALKHMDISFNTFTGRLPDGIGNLSSLSHLDISVNDFSGSISDALDGLRKLQYLSASRNEFTGRLPDGIGNLSSLRHLDISVNGFSGTIPDVFDGLSKLQYFSASDNFFTGGPPASLSSCSMLASLNLGNNSLTGKIGLDFTRLVRLRTLSLESNGFFGRIPKNLSFCRELEILNLADNYLHGQIPKSLKKLQALSVISLSNNNLSNVSRAFAVLSECRNLTVLILSINFPAGEVMPADGINIGLGFENLQVLTVAGCSLSGYIPSWLRSCAELRLLDLSSNHLAGQVPPWMGAFPRLVYLALSNNSLGGVLPDTLANLSGLTSLDITFLPFLVPLRLKGIYRRFRFIPPALDLSSNMMNGSILKGFGKLVGLRSLDLSNNNLSGSIPEELSNLSRLESLDLSHNSLSGEIPSSLADLPFLSHFSVAYNHLQGPIPDRRQFSTFDDSSYTGNPELCLTPPCEVRPSPHGNANDTDIEEEFRVSFMPLPYGIGVLIGFFPTVICGFYCGYRRRKRKERID